MNLIAPKNTNPKMKVLQNFIIRATEIKFVKFIRPRYVDNELQ